MPSFATTPEYRELLDISKNHLDALDRSRISDGRVIGQDNFGNLKVSTVFAAIAIEAALNDYLLCHCLFVDNRYLQRVFGATIRRFLRTSVQDKLEFVKTHWSRGFPNDILADVKKLFLIRNRVVHQTGEFRPAENPDGSANISNLPLSDEHVLHMLRHYEIVNTFLSMFWLPGNRELQQGPSV